MRFPAKVLFVLVMLLVAPAALAQVFTGDVENKDGISDGCGDTMNPDECMSSGNWTATICSNEACPACGFDSTMTKSICYRLYGNYGYCTCTGGGIGVDKNGNKYPKCTTSGSCALRR